MTGTAFLFPGQGSQAVGMATTLAAESQTARDILSEIDDALDFKLSALMADGPAEELQLTQNAQPALFASSLCTLRVLQEQAGQPIDALCSFAAGHSLGEYSALCAAGSIGIAETAKLLRLRGQSMQQAVPVGEGAMAALIGADLALAEEIAEAAADAGLVQIANDNANGQIVLSGSSTGVERAMEVAKDKGLRRVVKLPVSAPFHCELMAPAADVMAQALAEINIKDAMVPVVQNVTVIPETSASVLRKHLVMQVTGRVRWRETMDYFIASGVTRFVEVGTGKVLSGLAKRAAPDAQIHTLDTSEDIQAYLG
ncbi:malonyl CoA-acyl carrier protein transacylase [SAR116 cluster alpha proteobacterium HIMB100]|nr:malonyl CoA-acyl carrier protein transacylase [SAR116 cluster alpha proteobacterium HIMB100]